MTYEPRKGEELRLKIEVYTYTGETKCIEVKRVFGEVADFVEKFKEISKFVSECL